MSTSQRQTEVDVLEKEVQVETPKTLVEALLQVAMPDIEVLQAPKPSEAPEGVGAS